MRRRMRAGLFETVVREVAGKLEGKLLLTPSLPVRLQVDAFQPARAVQAGPARSLAHEDEDGRPQILLVRVSLFAQLIPARCEHADGHVGPLENGLGPGARVRAPSLSRGKLVPDETPDGEPDHVEVREALRARLIACLADKLLVDRSVLRPKDDGERLHREREKALVLLRRLLHCVRD